MATPLDTRRLVRESAPVAVVLLFWIGLSRLFRPTIAAGVLRAGVVMALLYAVVRGVALAPTCSATPRPADLRELLAENARVALPAGVWFLAAQVVYFVEGLWDLLGVPGAFTSPADDLAFVFVGAGVAAVLLYAVPVGLRRTGAVVGDDTGTSDEAAETRRR